MGDGRRDRHRVVRPTIGADDCAWAPRALAPAPLVLLDNLCYLKAFYRAESGEPAAIPGQPVVHVTTFDGPRPSTVNDICTSNGNWSPLKVVEVGACGGRVSVAHGATTETTISLATGRRVAGVLITDNADGLVEADGELFENPEGPAPGVSTYVFTDAVGTSYCHDRVLADLPADPGTYGAAGVEGPVGGPTGNTLNTPNNELFYIPIGLGSHGEPTGARPGVTSARPGVPVIGRGSAMSTRDGTNNNADPGSDGCPCTCGAPNYPGAIVVTNTNTAASTNLAGGMAEFPTGIVFNTTKQNLPLVSPSDIEVFPVKGQSHDDPTALRFRRVVEGGVVKYYRYVGRKIIDGDDVDVWGGPGSAITDDGEWLDGRSYEVPQHVIDLLRSLAPGAGGGLEVPDSFYRILSAMTALALPMDEVYWLVGLYSDGTIDLEEFNGMLGKVAEWAIGEAACIIASAGIATAAAIAMKLIKRYKLTQRLLEWYRAFRKRRANSKVIAAMEKRANEIKNDANLLQRYARIREGYHADVKGLKALEIAMRKEGRSAKEIAMALSKKRADLKRQYRAMLDPRDKAELDRIAPIQDYEYYVQKYTEAGHSGNALWEKMIEAAQRSNAAANSIFGVD